MPKKDILMRCHLGRVYVFEKYAPGIVSKKYQPLLMAVLGVAHLQGGWPEAVFYPFGHPTLYVYEKY
jgi:hypothetical protein